jgi:uncharacterized protein YndB with AHSA1/START domain
MRTTPERGHANTPDARVAVFARTHETTVEDLWNACANPERLRRWY